MTSSQAVIKSVSKKLKYYFEVKRKEDGFDITGPDCPKLDHPPLKARPTLMYDGLHDRPLKHYFSPTDVRTMLTQMNPPEGKEARERKIKKSVTKYMRKYQFTPSPLADEYYQATRKGGKKLRREAQGYGVPLQKKKRPHKGMNPTLRTVPSANLTRGEAARLVNMASRILVATETYDLKGGKKKDKDDSYGSGGGGRGAPRSFESSNGLPRIDEKQSKNKSKYDIHGRRIKKGKKREDEDSAYSTRPGSASPMYVSNMEGEEADNRQVKPWLRKEMHKSDIPPEDRGSDNQWVRPYSASDAHQPHPPKDKKGSHRPYSSKQRRDSASSDEARIQPKDKKAWGSENSVNSSRSSEAAVQTGGELMRNYDVDERVIEHGEKTRYKIHVYTGNRLGASTKADVRIVLIGEKGRTEEIPLKNSKTHKLPFQKGQEDVFLVDSFSVGTISKIGIGHDKLENAYGWYLARVQVKDTKKKICYIFNAEKWLSGQEGDGRTFKNLTLQERVGYHDVPESEIDYTPTAGQVVTLVRTDAKPKTTTAEVAVHDHGHSDDDTSSRTSVDTQPSSRDGDRKPSPRKYESSSESEDEPEPEPEPEPPKVEVTARPQTPPKPPSPPPPKPDDDFFDQRVVEKDYSSVIESLSTEQDNKDDFNSSAPLGQIVEKHEGPARLVLRTSTYEEEPPRPRFPDSSSSSSSSDSSDSEDDRNTARLTHNEVEAEPQSQVLFVEKKVESDSDDEFTPRYEVPRMDDDSDSSSDNESESTRPSTARGPTIHSLAKSGDLDRMKRIVENNPEQKTATDERGWAPLHIAAAQGHTEVVQWLSVSLLDLDVLTPTGYTAMHLASMHGHVGCMMVLSAMGAKPGCKTLDEQTPLHLAAAGGHLENVKWLVANHADTRAKDASGRTPLDLAVDYSQNPVVDFLRGVPSGGQSSSVGQHLASTSTSADDQPTTSHTTSTPKVQHQDSSDSEDDDTPRPQYQSRNDRVKSAAPRRQRYESSSDSSTDSSTDVSSSESDNDSDDEAAKRKHDAEIMQGKKKLREETYYHD